jgi:hypothetical protein
LRFLFVDCEDFRTRSKISDFNGVSFSKKAFRYSFKTWYSGFGSGRKTFSNQSEYKRGMYSMLILGVPKEFQVDLE